MHEAASGERSKDAGAPDSGRAVPDVTTPVPLRRRSTRIAIACATLGVVGSAALGATMAFEIGDPWLEALPALGFAHVVGALCGLYVLWSERAGVGSPHTRGALLAVAAPLLSGALLYVALLPGRIDTQKSSDRMQAQAHVRQVWRIVRRNRTPEDVAAWDYWLSDLVDPDEREVLRYPGPREPGSAAAASPWQHAVSEFLLRFDQRPDVYRAASVVVDPEAGDGTIELTEPKSGRSVTVHVVRRGKVWFLSLRPPAGVAGEARPEATGTRHE